MPANETGDLLLQLATAGLLTSTHATAQPLKGGVSSDIWLVSESHRRFVVKRALAKLRVRDDWFADTNRNRIERDWLIYAAGVVPGSVPRVLQTPKAADWFAMEFMGDKFPTWKSQLLTGVAVVATASRAGEIIGRLHANSWGRADLAQQFDTHANFHELRIAPYLLTTADRVADLAPHIHATAVELGQTKLALVHGDYSPKNLLIGRDRLVILDAEVACFGDPAFDAAFLLTHLLLKGLLQATAPATRSILNLMIDFWRSYRIALRTYYSSALEARTVRITLCLLLARVHGKSPVEYLQPAHRGIITEFVRQKLPADIGTVEDLRSLWEAHLLASAIP